MGRARIHCRAGSHSSTMAKTARNPGGSMAAQAQPTWYTAAAVARAAAVDTRYSSSSTRREGACQMVGTARGHPVAGRHHASAEEQLAVIAGG